ncbi:MAG: hypothetical protein JSR59_22995 [Proteobacteria bacterium]|nr:hypothetical protein [Pseudomonadota bacterium]
MKHADLRGGQTDERFSADGAMRLADARERYFAAYGFDAGGYRARHVHLRVAGMALTLPNVQARQAALPYHDVHHILTGYAPATSTTPIGDPAWHGEAELAAWEFGVQRTALGQWEVWLVNSYAVVIGLARCPGKVVRAYLRGCSSDTLYGQPIDAGRLDHQPLAQLRSQLGLDRASAPASPLRLLRLGALATLALATVGVFTLGVVLPLAAVQSLRAAFRNGVRS